MSDLRNVLSKSILSQGTDIIVAMGVILVVMMLIIPMPTIMLDFLMAVNLTISVLVVLTVLFIRRALEFAIFPTLLLVITIFGLALNVSSTRLILTMGSRFDGQIVRAFATFVTGSEGLTGLVVGIIIFTIIIAVQILVITKGATRVAEVAARFMLDSLPGKQMAIEAELNNGSVSEEEAQRKKNDLQREVDFYGAMDGASKFVSGNVKVGVLITFINMLGGVIVGMAIHNEPWDIAFNTYVSLTIGDGLVSQFPALLVSSATGLIVTRAISTGTFGSDLRDQFSQYSKIYWVAAAALLVMAFLPGQPTMIFLILALGSGLLAYKLSRSEINTMEKEEISKAAKAQPEGPAEISPVVPVDAVSLELGYALIPFVDKEQGAELLERITRIRREAALDLGVVVPPIRIVDNIRLEPNEYCAKIKGMEVGRGTVRTGRFLAINPGSGVGSLEGEETIDPAFGLPALWISEGQKDEAERSGYTVVDGPSIIATHLTEIIKQHAKDLVGRQEVQKILSTLERDYSAVVADVRKDLNTGLIQKVLQGLLGENVSIRNIVPIMETLADYAPVSKDIGFLVEKCRQALGRQIVLSFVDENKALWVLTINPAIEQSIIDSAMETSSGYIAALEPDFKRQWINAVIDAFKTVQDRGHYPIILCSEAARSLVRNSTVRDIPQLIVLSLQEVPTDIQVHSLGEINLDE